MSMEDNTCVTYFIKGMKVVVTQLIAIGEIIQDLMIVHIVMNALLAHFNNLVQFMTTQNKLPSFDKLVGKLFMEKHRREVKFGKQRNDEALFF
jgi:hypothetical protein